MNDLLEFLGNTLFGVGVIALLVFIGIGWYLRTMGKKAEQLKR